MPIKTKVKTPELPYQLQLIALTDIKEADNNVKEHTQEQIDAIIASIKEFGFRDPVSLDQDLVLIEGHGRVLALRQMGVKHVPALVFKDMTPLQIRQYRIAHNQIPMLTGFNIEALTVELRDLQTLAGDIQVTGFTMDDLSSMEATFAIADTDVTNEEGEGKEEETVKNAPSEPVVASKTYQYIMIFDDKDQFNRWSAFLKHLKVNGSGETAAERVNNYLQAQGF